MDENEMQINYKLRFWLAKQKYLLKYLRKAIHHTDSNKFNIQ